MKAAAVLATEFLKLRRSKIMWLTGLAIAFGPLVGGLFMWIIAEPERAAQLGLIGQKAQFLGATADWTGFFTMLMQTMGVVSVVLFSVVTAWVFGREYSDGTAKNMLALPIRRAWFPIAKMVVVLVWCGLLTAVLIAIGLGVGFAMGLPGFSTALALASVRDIALTALLGVVLMPPVAWFAILGKGYMAPLGFALLTLLLGNVVGATGWSKWFPWSIVPLYAGVAGPRAELLAPASVVIVVATGAAGLFATIRHLTYADNDQ
ncbi:MAG: ABC transporter permease [Gemmatimonadota bacterium]